MVNKKRIIKKNKNLRISPLASVSFITIAIVGSLFGIILMRIHIPLGISVLIVSGALLITYIQTIEKGLF